MLIELVSLHHKQHSIPIKMVLYGYSAGTVEHSLSVSKIYCIRLM